MGSKGRSGIIGFDYVRLSGQDGAKNVAGYFLTVSLCACVRACVSCARAELSVKSGRRNE